ncbi:hypothetical protein [Desulfoscipio gibsoniae]|uniref:Uncharacterized protein n=1 Tax=Desulfoscipio gibsoniae DSM 7213 TaxID=767817 RepID=R4KAS4_9FIRM|nr:hypothetical protein [Desulfoscipio gibsoniae]AGK99663.1 hypothetical protein Desgi_0043 [Desulfoscipio gibsoniae DSM 7213]
MKTVVFCNFKGMEGPASQFTCIATDDFIMIEESLSQEEKELITFVHGGSLPLAKEA